MDPILKPLDDYDEVRVGNMITEPINADENVMFINTIYSQYTCSKLVEYIGNIIVSFYKSDNISKQSLWCSDLSRMTFLVRILPDGSQCNRWISDGQGEMVKTKVIKPLLNYIATCIDSYNIKTLLSNKTSEIEKCSILNDIVLSIRNNNLTKEVTKYIAPHFTLNQKLTIKDNKK
jgi:hypothetical protein